MIEMIMELSKNPVFGGIVGGSVLTGILIYLRKIPHYIWILLKKYFTYKLTVTSTNNAEFSAVENWLSSISYIKNDCKSFKLISLSNLIKNNFCLENLSIGYGKHIFIHNKKIFIVSKTLDSKEQHTHEDRPETIEIKYIGFNVNGVKKVLKEVVDSSFKETENQISIYVPNSYNYWTLFIKKDKRDLNTVYIPPNQKQKILNDIDCFLDSKEKYKTKSIPYRRGYLFKGPPGTGKTSLGFAIASHYNKKVYFLNITNIKDNNSLNYLFNTTKPGSIIILEDIDRIEFDTKGDKITLDGVLNILDGVISCEDRIIIMTTNHPEKIDPALIRPGRIDVIETIDYIQPMEIVEMCNHLLDDKSKVADFVQELDFENLTAAELQNKILIKNAA